MVMSLLDVMAGFMVTIAAARRDFAVADRITEIDSMNFNEITP